MRQIPAIETRAACVLATLPALRNTEGPVPRILHHGLVDSSSERAFAALADGTARDGDVHVARGQTAGRGRRGRRWVSAPDEGLYLSLIHLPPSPGPRPASLTMASGLAVLDALGRVGVRGARLEWPNDVVLDGAKLAGVLVESRGLDPARPHHVVGIGINVRQRAFPPELEAERAVTSLARAGHEVAPDDLVPHLVEALAARLEEARTGPAALARDFLAATGLAGATVCVRVEGEERRGLVEELDPEHGLLLRTAAGERVRLELAHVQALDAVSAPL